MESSSSTAAAQPPSQVFVQSTLVMVQLIFGAGGVIAALGLPSCNPFAFALYREMTAGVILLLAATITMNKSSSNGSAPSNEMTRARSSSVLSKSDSNKNLRSMEQGGASGGDSSKNSKQILEKHTDKLAWLPWHFSNESDGVWRLLFLGLCVFGNQAFVVVGLKLAGPVACAVWQPSQPIMTAAICMLMQWEPFHLQRVMGVVMAFIGCATMVILSTKAKPSHDESLMSLAEERTLGFQSLLGNCFFFVNCLFMSLYVIVSKPALQIYPSLFVTAWSYNVAAILMAAAAWLAAQFDEFMNLICPECSSDSIWVIPSGAYFALFYYIVFVSVLAYAAVTWANQFATGTLVMGYTVLQPVTAATLTVVLLAIQAFPSCSGRRDPSQACLEWPGLGTLLGMCGVFVGLFFVISTEPKAPSKGGGSIVLKGSRDSTHKKLELEHSDTEDEDEDTSLELRLLSKSSGNLEARTLERSRSEARARAS